MTDFDDVPGTSIDNMLRKERAELSNDLAAVLDIEAGLREAMIAARHTDLVRDLRGVLDIDAGLSAFVPPAPVPSRPETEIAASWRRRLRPKKLSRRETAHVGSNPFSASSWRRPWKRIRLRQQHPAPPDQAAAFIEMRLLTRTLAGYFTNLTDRADDLAVGMKRANKECQHMVAPVLVREQYPSTDALNDTEKALQQVVVDAGGLALDLEAPCELASKLADTARVAKDRSLVRAGADLAVVLTGCRENAKGAWSSLNQARGITAWLAAVHGATFFELSRVQQDVARIRDLVVLAMDQQAGLVTDLKTATDRNPARYLDSIEIDASGADLSDADVPDIDILDLVIWTHETKWPVALEDGVQKYSKEIREGVYQVYTGGRTRYKSVDV